MIAENPAQRDRNVMISGCHVIRSGQSAHELAQSTIFFLASRLRQVAGRYHEVRRARIDRADALAQRVIEVPHSFSAGLMHVKIAYLRDSNHEASIPSRKSPQISPCGLLNMPETETRPRPVLRL